MVRVSSSSFWGSHLAMERSLGTKLGIWALVLFLLLSCALTSAFPSLKSKSQGMAYIAPSSAKMYAFLRRLEENCLNQVIRIASDEVKGIGICFVDLRGIRSYISFSKSILKSYMTPPVSQSHPLTDPPNGISSMTFWNWLVWMDYRSSNNLIHLSQPFLYSQLKALGTEAQKG